jgi:hypothetical protein
MKHVGRTGPELGMLREAMAVSVVRPSTLSLPQVYLGRRRWHLGHSIA